MLHSLKKKASLAQGAATGGVPLPPEVLMLKQKLAGVRKMLADSTSAVDKANARVKVDVSEQMTFAKMFARAYPLGPDAPPPPGAAPEEVDAAEASEGRDQAAAFAKHAEAVYNGHCRAGSPDEKWAQYKAMNEKVKAYVAAVEKVEAKYPRLTAAKSESLRYNAKFDALMQKGKADDLKMTRNLQKSDGFKARYQKLLAEVLAEQRALYAKAPDACRVALVAYHGARARCADVLRQTFDETAAWARENEDELAAMDVAALDFPVDDHFGADDAADAADDYQDAAGEEEQAPQDAPATPPSPAAALDVEAPAAPLATAS